MRMADDSVKNTTLSAVTGESSGACRSCQSGINSFKLRGSRTAPDKICAPTSLPFSIRQTSMSRPSSAASCFKRMAADSPDGPPPTTTTSNSITSRSIFLSPLCADQAGSVWKMSFLQTNIFSLDLSFKIIANFSSSCDD